MHRRAGSARVAGRAVPTLKPDPERGHGLRPRALSVPAWRSPVAESMTLPAFMGMLLPKGVRALR